MARGNATKKIKEYFSQFRYLKLAAGEVLVYEQNIPSGVYYLTRGVIRHFATSSEGRELTIHFYTPGSFLPLMWAINNQIPDYSLSAFTNCTLQMAPKDDFLKWLDQEPEVLYNLSSRLLFGISGLSSRIEVISLENSHARVASILLYLTKHFGDEKAKGTIRIIHPFSHEDIASLTGLTRERVSIEMKKMKDQGLIDYKRSDIEILEPTKLEPYSKS